jgi:hypothetical protein
MIATAKIWCWLCAGSVVALLAGAAPPDLVPDSLRVPPRVVPAAKTVLLAEDFKNLDAWQSDREGAWSVEQGVLCAHLPDEKQEHALLYAGSESWGDYAVDLDLYQVRGVDKGVLVRARGNQGVLVDLRGGEYQDVIVYRGRHPLGRAPAANVDGRWHHLRVVANGNRYAVIVDGRSVLECRDPLPGGRRGRIALPAYTGGKGMCVIFYANVTVTAAENGR